MLELRVTVRIKVRVSVRVRVRVRVRVNHDLTTISIIRVLTRHLYNYNTMMISQMSVFCEFEKIDLFQC